MAFINETEVEEMGVRSLCFLTAGSLEVISKAPSGK